MRLGRYDLYNGLGSTSYRNSEQKKEHTLLTLLMESTLCHDKGDQPILHAISFSANEMKFYFVL